MFNKKAYMREYFKEYRLKPEVKAKRIIEAKKNYQRQKIKLESQRKQEKSKKAEMINKNIIKHVRKDLAIKRKREKSKEILNKYGKRLTLFDSFDLCILLILDKRKELLTFELQDLTGLSQINFRKHISRLETLDLIIYKQKAQNKFYELTERGLFLLEQLRQNFLNYISIKKQNMEERSMMLEIMKNAR